MFCWPFLNKGGHFENGHNFEFDIVTKRIFDHENPYSVDSVGYTLSQILNFIYLATILAASLDISVLLKFRGPRLGSHVFVHKYIHVSEMKKKTLKTWGVSNMWVIWSSE